MEHLRNESDFGYGSDEVIASENKIHGYLMILKIISTGWNLKKLLKTVKKSILSLRSEWN